MNPLRGGFPDGGGLRINRRARSLSVCVLEDGPFAEGGVGGSAVDGLLTPAGWSGAFWTATGRGGVAAPGWLVDRLVGSGVGVDSMSLINDYNSNF
jgi:hypothetical protein